MRFTTITGTLIALVASAVAEEVFTTEQTGSNAEDVIFTEDATKTTQTDPNENVFAEVLESVPPAVRDAQLSNNGLRLGLGITNSITNAVVASTAIRASYSAQAAMFNAYNYNSYYGGVYGRPVVYTPPIYSPPVYAAPVYSAPVYSAPVYSAPVYAAPAANTQYYYAPVNNNNGNSYGYGNNGGGRGYGNNNNGGSTSQYYIPISVSTGAPIQGGTNSNVIRGTTRY